MSNSTEIGAGMGAHSSAPTRAIPTTSKAGGTGDEDLENDNTTAVLTSTSLNKVGGNDGKLERSQVGRGQGRKRSLNPTSTSPSGRVPKRTRSGRVVKRNSKYFHSSIWTTNRGARKNLAPAGSQQKNMMSSSKSKKGASSVGTIGPILATATTPPGSAEGTLPTVGTFPISIRPCSVTLTRLKPSSYGSVAPAKIPIVSAGPPRPPNFQQHLEETLDSLSTHQTFTIQKDSEEFKEIARLVSPCTPVSVEQIVNPNLWQRFSTARKEMLRTKSEDLNLLSKLFPMDKEVLRAAQLSLKFKKSPFLITNSGKFSPNEALLFHCTRDPKNLKKILNQGLDDRLGSAAGGRFGKGIYFSDNVEKSITYDGTGGTIIIFAVLLGDCLGILPNSYTALIVREPWKELKERRNVNDTFFDAITSKSTGDYNEYVIYNRFQCCPLYLVKFDAGAVRDTKNDPYYNDRWDIPAIAWRSTDEGRPCKPSKFLARKGWPFFADTIFKRMGVVSDPPNSDSNSMSDDLNQKIKILVSLGFADEGVNRETLEKCEHDLNLTVICLMNGDIQQQPSTSGSVKATRILLKVDRKRSHPPPPVTVTIDSSSEDEDDQPKTIAAAREMCKFCPFHYASFDQSPKLWKELKCGHRPCWKCHKKLKATRSTMAGITHTFVKCPFCKVVTGTEVGNCPPGQMKMDIIDEECAGYPDVKTIRITYDINTDQYKTSRIAYLPQTWEGSAIMTLLQAAWDRRLCFKIGTSLTTGQQNVPVWNIQHKTSTKGGVQSYGYPDPGYFERVQEELKAYGIE